MLIYAHRGYSAKYPENTLSAFKAALPHVDGIELDVQLTRDGRLVVIHDETVDRTTNGNGFVKDMTLRQLRLLRTEGGERIPTLEEVLVLIEPSDVTLNIELKTDSIRLRRHRVSDMARRHRVQARRARRLLVVQSGHARPVAGRRPRRENRRLDRGRASAPD